MGREPRSERKGKRILFWCRDLRWPSGDAQLSISKSFLANYFWFGAWFCGTVGGVDGAGCDFVWDGFKPESADVGPTFRAAKIDSVIDVSMKIIADHVVARERTEAAPRGPNAVWLP
jgi:hypothetical protein